MGNTWRIKRHVLIKRTFFNGVEWDDESIFGKNLFTCSSWLWAMWRKIK